MQAIINDIYAKLEAKLEQLLPKEIYQQWWLVQSQDIGVSMWQEPWQHAAQNLVAPMHDLIMSGGKRWRAMALILTGLSWDLDLELLLNLATLVEVPHNASLAIDDIEDDASLRRGQPAMHIVYGTDNTINSANFAYFAPLTLLDDLALSNDTKVLLYQCWHLGMRRVHMGQALDISWHNLDLIPNQNEYEVMAQLKTGALAAMGIDLVSVVAQQSLESRELLHKAWLDVGLGFQVLDDALNLSHGIKGKQQADDLIEGKKSLPIVLYCAKFPQETMHFTSLLNDAKLDKAKASQALELLLESQMVQQAHAYGLAILERGIQQIACLLPNNEYAEALVLMLKDFERQLQA